MAEIAQALLAGLASSGTADVAAQVKAERRAFGALSAAYFANPRRALGGADAGGGYVKFGPPAVETLLTPVCLAAGNAILAYLCEKVGTMTLATLRRILSPSAPAPALTAEQWAEVQQIMVTALIRHGRMSPQRAEMLGAATVGDGLTRQQKAG